MKESEFTKHRRRYSRFTRMGRDKVTQLNYLLASGNTCIEVANHIQEIWGDSLDIKATSLEKQLQRYRKDVVYPTLDTKVEFTKENLQKWEEGGKAEGTAVHARAGAAEDSVILEGVVILSNAPSRNALADIEELIEVQRARLLKLYERELKTPILLGDTTREIKQLADLYKQHSSLQMDMGLITRVPRKHQLEGLNTSALESKTHYLKSKEQQDRYCEAVERTFNILSSMGVVDEDE